METEKTDMMKVVGGISLFAAMVWLIVWLIRRG